MEKTLLELKEELKKAEAGLADLLEEVHVDPSFDHPFESGGLLDGHSDGFTYLRLRSDSDPSAAVYYWKIIGELKGRITSFARDQESEERAREARVIDDENFRKNLILSYAKDLYSQYLKEYKKSGILEKASLFLSGNNPILNNDEEILEVYGKAAVDIILAPALAEIKRRWDEQLKGVNNDYGGNAEELERARRQTKVFFEGESSRLRATYENSLSKLLSNGKDGVRGR